MNREALLARRASPNRSPRTPNICRGRHFSCGKMAIPASVRSSCVAQENLLTEASPISPALNANSCQECEQANLKGMRAGIGEHTWSSCTDVRSSSVPVRGNNRQGAVPG